jgi:ubiquinone/menaquinone biosynthesis C-methylase UbiE
MAATNKLVEVPFQAIAIDYERMLGGTTRVIARHIIAQAPPIDASSVVLDNACGNGIVIEEIYATLPPSTHPVIEAADLAPAMVDLLKANSQQRGWQHVTAQNKGGEDLDYADATFTHSFTNFGILFFKDPVKGAEQVYRTLRPGGTALLTTWHDLGYLKPFRRAETALRPGAEKKPFAISEEWESGQHAKDVMVQGGFEQGKVRTYLQPSYMWASSVDALIGNMKIGLNAFLCDWSEAELSRFDDEFKKELAAVPGLVEDVDGGVKLHMVANVVVCQK